MFSSSLILPIYARREARQDNKRRTKLSISKRITNDILLKAIEQVASSKDLSWKLTHALMQTTVAQQLIATRAYNLIKNKELEDCVLEIVGSRASEDLVHTLVMDSLEAEGNPIVRESDMTHCVESVFQEVSSDIENVRQGLDELKDRVDRACDVEEQADLNSEEIEELRGRIHSLEGDMGRHIASEARDQLIEQLVTLELDGRNIVSRSTFADELRRVSKGPFGPLSSIYDSLNVLHADVREICMELHRRAHKDRETPPDRASLKERYSKVMKERNNKKTK